jgi:hypothetical protein
VPRPNRLAIGILALVIGVGSASGCSVSDGPPDPDTIARGPEIESGTDTAADDVTARPDDDASRDDATMCRHDELAGEPLVELTGDDPVWLAGQVADISYACAPVVVVAPVDDPWAAAMAAPVARFADGPLLLATAADDVSLAARLSAWETGELVTVGIASPSAPIVGTELVIPGDGDAETPASDGLRRVQLAVRVADHLDTDTYLAVDADDEEARGAALARLAPDVALLPLPREQLEDAAEELPAAARIEVLASAQDRAARLADELIGLGIDAQPLEQEGDLWPTGGATTWLVDPAEGAIAAVGAVAAAGRDETLLPIDADDPRSDRARTTRVREAQAQRHVLLGAVGDHARWQLETVLEGDPLPWGGFRLFEDERMVALYGNVEFETLGALGEQGLDETVERLRTAAEPYGADGARVLPAFELITTIASAQTGDEGDYSRRTPIELLQPWVQRAAEEELYVVLDLQPGRTDFLTQAREYEELLREPHVGLALDPEWRLKPDQRHLRQIGSVEAAEVQEVADWLAELTREHRLPEKLLVLHQFRFSMLPDRDTIVTPSELAVVVHMDGQGPLGAKYETYDAITAGAEDRWLWGWKNFYDEDVPTPTPEQVLALDPTPVLVTYQ